MKHESVEYFSSRITSDNFVVVDSQNEHSTNPNKRVEDCKLKKSAGLKVTLIESWCDLLAD